MNKNNSEVKSAFIAIMNKLNNPSYYELEAYGVTPEEYTYPTIDTLRKLKDYAMDLKYNRKVR